MNELNKINSDLLNSFRQENFKGYDPFDFLNSKLFNSTPLKNIRLFRLALIQLGKHLPINIRPLIGVSKKRNPKGIALIILGLIQNYNETKNSDFLNEALILADWLTEQRCDKSIWSHSCWGYHFDWQARSFNVPCGKPNLVSTFYVARALYDLGTITKNEKFIDIALDSAKFISLHLYNEVNGRSFFRYIPEESTFVHNANLMGAAWCAFVGKNLGNKTMIEQSLKAINLSVSEQTEQGAWLYGTNKFHNFIDGFHTGYNLEVLSFIKDILQTTEYDGCIQAGYSFYLKNFITKTGLAKYYNNSIYPLDSHSFSQAILTILKVGGQNSDIEICDNIVNQFIEKMYLPKKRMFIYQKYKWFSNKINYIRWTQAWSYYSLSYYVNFKRMINDEKN